jgi:peptidyl-prolyl cis-trans isomerase SurA
MRMSMRFCARRIPEFRCCHIRHVAIALSVCVAIGPAMRGQSSSVSNGSQSVESTSQHPIVLDSVIAIVNGDVLLQSDLQEEMNLAAIQPLSLPPGKGLELRAAQRLINQALISQQMRDQGMAGGVTDEEVQENLAALRKQLPACVPYKCETEAGWARFLADHNLTPAEVDAKWRQRMEILRFIDARFRAGVRISNAEIADYYKKTFVPEFKAENAHPPELAAVSQRIEEILLQQHVNVLLQDWLKSLRDQGVVQILDPRFDDGTNANAGEDGDGQ